MQKTMSVDEVKSLTGTKKRSAQYKRCPSGSVIRFSVLHEPVAAPRMTQKDKWAHRPCVDRYREFKDAIRAAAPALPFPADIETFSWTAYFTPPKSWPEAKRQAAIGKLHRVRPDRDNLDKAILDALFAEDSAIAAGMIMKMWGIEAKLDIEIVVS